jgi:hypothetical protein
MRWISWRSRTSRTTQSRESVVNPANQLTRKSQEAGGRWARVRLVVLLVAFATSVSLAGCSQGPGGSDFHGTCPAWIKGLSTNVYQEGFQNSSMPDQKFDPQHPTGAGLLHFQNHTLDLVDLDFNPRNNQPQAVGVANGTLELRVLRSSDQSILRIRDLRDGPGAPGQDHVTFKAGVYRNFTLQVALAAPDQPPAPEPVLLRWDFIPDDNPRTPSEAVMLYTAYFWYRTCSSDGTPT